MNIDEASVENDDLSPSRREVTFSTRRLSMIVCGVRVDEKEKFFVREESTELRSCAANSRSTHRMMMLDVALRMVVVDTRR